MSGASREIKITAGTNNEQKFDVTALTATAGEEIKITLTIASTQPKMIMGHNFVLLKPGTDVTDFGLDAAGSTPAANYIPDSMKAAVVANTKLLGPGETDSVTFKVPGPGAYPFLCSFPGHFGTMNGILTVK